MFSKIKLIVAFIIGIIGVIGQSYLLHHELIDCYPYKIMSSPPPSFYENIATYGIYFAPTISIFISILIGLKRNWLITILPVVLCPLIFAIVFSINSIANRLMENNDLVRNFDGTLPETVALGFFFYTIELSFFGLFIGGICSFLLFRRKELNLL
jgi:hypothetical protein